MLARTIAHRERRHNRDSRHDGRDNKGPGEDLRSLARRPALERVDDEVILERPALKGGRQDCVARLLVGQHDAEGLDAV